MCAVAYEASNEILMMSPVLAPTRLGARESCWCADCRPCIFVSLVCLWRWLNCIYQDTFNSTHSVVASYKPSMLVTWVRFPVCAFCCGPPRQAKKTGATLLDLRAGSILPGFFGLAHPANNDTSTHMHEALNISRVFRADLHPGSRRASSCVSGCACASF